MADSGTRFSYARLALAKDQKQIRLLKLLPSLDANQILCTLEVVNWTSELQYAAISYVWGDPIMKKAIFINNQPFYTTDNLYTALWYIRKNDMLRQDGSEQPLLLWADAVCIDQANNEERNHQVSLMGSIYGSACKIIYWLGRLEDDNMSEDEAITTIQEMAEAAFHDGSDLDTDSLKKFLTTHKGLSELNTTTHNSAALRSSPPVLRSILQIINREFWTRIWIIQEIVLPVSHNDLRFTCGNSITTWTRFQQFFEIVVMITQSNDNTFGLPGSVFRGLTNAFRTGGPHVFMLSQFRRRDTRLGPGSLPSLATLYKASNPLDYVYGFRAVLGIQPVVSYEKSKKEVYMDWFKDAMKHSPSTNLISFAGIGLLGPANQEWPSWLPDLASIYDTPNKLAIRTMMEERPVPQLPPGDIDGNMLHISGVRLGDTVAKIFKPGPGAPKHEDGSIPALIHYISFSILASASSHHPLGVPPLQAFLITVLHCFMMQPYSRILAKDPLDTEDTNDDKLIGIMLSLVYPEYGPHSNFSHDDYLSKYGPGWVSMGLLDGKDLVYRLQKQCVATYRPSDKLLGPPAPLTHLNLIAFLNVRLASYATFQTTNGHIGIGPPGIKEGDELCFFSGRASPMLLRLEKENENMVTKLVGACYIHESSVAVMKDSVASGSAKYERLSLH